MRFDRNYGLINAFLADNDSGNRRVPTKEIPQGVGFAIQARSTEKFRLTRPFYQLGIVKEHHGEMSLETEDGVSSKFHMDLKVNNGWSYTSECGKGM